MTGRMLPQKDFGTFLDAARILAGLEPGRWLFVAVGWGGNRQSLVERNADLVERKVVVFPEGRHEVIGLVRACHAGVLLTTPKVHAEGLANSIIEYMACGLPVVCSDSGGNRELIQDGVSGFVIPATDPYVLVQKLLVLREDPDLARQMGERGRRKVLDELSVQQMVLATTEVYEELCGGSRDE
jgi:glycosyltransferase involved in cell wall biosynthesis